MWTEARGDGAGDEGAGAPQDACATARATNGGRSSMGLCHTIVGRGLLGRAWSGGGWSAGWYGGPAMPTVQYLEVVTRELAATTALYETLWGVSFGEAVAELGGRRHRRAPRRDLGGDS